MHTNVQEVCHNEIMVISHYNFEFVTPRFCKWQATYMAHCDNNRAFPQLLLPWERVPSSRTHLAIQHILPHLFLSTYVHEIAMWRCKTNRIYITGVINIDDPLFQYQGYFVPTIGAKPIDRCGDVKGINFNMILVR